MMSQSLGYLRLEQSLPAEVRTTRRHSGRGEELPPPSSCGPVLCLESLRRNEQLENYGLKWKLFDVSFPNILLHRNSTPHLDF